MGLSDLQPFDVARKVIGLPRECDTALVQKTVKDFTDEVSRDTPAPGGGSVAALAGALGAGLASMVANLWQDKVDGPAADALLAGAESAQNAKERLILGVDEDTNAFNAYMEARRLPANTSEEKAHRERRMQEGLKVAVAVPFQTAQQSFAAMQAAWTAVQHGNVSSITDGAVGAQVGFAGVRGGIWNVLVNLKDVTDRAFVAEMCGQCDALLQRARALLDQVTAEVDARLAALIENKT
jgi:glutamate formiminotransferase/formiminotetrahydrofolate cyclodeaminase